MVLVLWEDFMVWCICEVVGEVCLCWVCKYCFGFFVVGVVILFGFIVVVL